MYLVIVIYNHLKVSCFIYFWLYAHMEYGMYASSMLFRSFSKMILLQHYLHV